MSSISCLKRSYLIGLWLCCSLFSLAQSREIRFETGSFDEALAKAGQSGRLVFVDGYTSWCGPCRLMAQTVFTLDSVADFFNSHFVNLKIDMEKGEGVGLKERYQIEVYPTFLLLNSKGEEIYRLVGGQSAPDFMRKIRMGMDPKNALSLMEKRYASGKRNAALIRDYCLALKRGFQNDRLNEVIEDYFRKMSVKQISQDQNWELYTTYVQDVDSPLHHRMIEKIDEFKQLRGKDAIENKLESDYSMRIFSALSGQKLDSAQIKRYAADIEKMGMDDQKSFYLRAYLRLACLKAEKKYDEILAFCEAGPEGFEEARKQTLMMSLSFMEDGTKQQRDRAMRYVISEARTMMARNGGNLPGNVNQVLGYIQYKLSSEEFLPQPVKDSLAAVYMVRYREEEARLNKLSPMNFQNPEAAGKIIRDKRDSLMKWIGNVPLDRVNVMLLQANAASSMYGSLLNLENMMRWIGRKDTVLPASFYAFIKDQKFDVPVWRQVKGMNELLTFWFAAGERNGYLESGDMDYLACRARQVGDSVVRENYVIYALQQEQMGYNQQLPQVIASVEGFICSPEGRKALEEIRQKQQERSLQFARLNAGQKAGNLAGKDKAGKKYSLKDYKGKVVVIDVWSTNCMPCIAEMPYLHRLEKQFEGKDVVFISYSVDLKNDKWCKCLEEKGWGGIQLIDNLGAKSPFMKHYAIHSTPRIIVIGKDGKIADCWAPKPSDIRLGKKIEALLQN